ncbi:von Willebrand factor A domain-containing protein [Ceratocystis fimbriata CBS 114723]|uniref:von Willebrand factor A domain-containing protein n=1 Tax=Ceratocystis fimbriata CBS 114723 TaxID=1035309 RepID=A0A2C5WWK4_9PEZI|nr:von Willebrand factor A domain-containing protein [Ceratocystis fimbriata CBS 114723]
MPSPEPNFPGGLWTVVATQRVNHPLVDSSAHTHITSYVARTVLTQTFVSTVASAAQTHYSFPLYDGISVISFSCDIDGKSIHGLVKEKQTARKDYESAVSQGHNAALLELSQNSDVYTISVGTVSVGATVKATIEYVGELRHDAESNGLRFTIPTHIAARYGASTDGGLSHNHPSGSFKLTVDTELAPGSEIKCINSPSHPISVNIGSISAELGPSIRSNPSKASVLCHLANAALDKDFVLNITATKLGEPMALFERHPTIPDEAALMVTLTPRFSLPLEKAEQPEIVFMCDRSGSMRGASIEGVRSSLRVFLKSLPVGAKFNICSFGSNYSMLWPKSRSYDNESFKEASLLVQNFRANMGGTNMYEALDAIFRQKSPQTTLDVIVLTDGQIWAQDHLFGLIRETVQSSNGAVRVFSIGIGSGTSSSLIEGIARNGNGFSQAVADGEVMDRKVMRMLKGALSARIYNVSLEVMYKSDLDSSVSTSGCDDDEDFEVVDRVSDSLIIESGEGDKSTRQGEAGEAENVGKDKPQHRNPVLIYDPAADVDEPALDSLNRDNDITTAPDFPVPPIIQAPAVIPSLFSSTRVSAYLLLSGTAAQRTPKSIIMRASSPHGPLEQIIPVAVLDQPSETIHQLAARKAAQELEDSLGWLHQAKDTAGTPLHAKYHDKFDDIVQRELVRLGVKYQISGKYTSFVAMERREDQSSAEIKDDLSSLLTPPTAMGVPRQQSQLRCSPSRPDSLRTRSSARSTSFSSPFVQGALLRYPSESLRSIASSRTNPGESYTRSCVDDGPSALVEIAEPPSSFAPILDRDRGLQLQLSEVPAPKPESAQSDLDIIINAAEICGSWEPDPKLMEVLGTTVDELSRKAQGVGDSRILVTAAVIGWLEKEAAGKREIWELLVDKARSWLASQGYAAQELVEHFS